ncbi:MAG: hypothetical protein ACR5LD_11045 [Symbiopectobacterium sp.]
MFMHPDVRDVAVVAVLDDTVYAVSSRQMFIVVGGFVCFFRTTGRATSRLPDALSVVKALPLTPMGKINKQTLTNGAYSRSCKGTDKGKETIMMGYHSRRNLILPEASNAASYRGTA